MVLRKAQVGVGLVEPAALLVLAVGVVHADVAGLDLIHLLLLAPRGPAVGNQAGGIRFILWLSALLASVYFGFV